MKREEKITHLHIVNLETLQVGDHCPSLLVIGWYSAEEVLVAMEVSKFQTGSAVADLWNGQSVQHIRNGQGGVCGHRT